LTTPSAKGEPIRLGSPGLARRHTHPENPRERHGPIPVRMGRDKLDKTLCAWKKELEFCDAPTPLFCVQQNSRIQNAIPVFIDADRIQIDFLDLRIPRG